MFKQYKRLGLIGVFIIIGVLIIACQGRTAPLIGPSVLESPIDQLGREELTIPAIPTPCPGCGVVVGRLVTEPSANLIGLSIFLGDIIVLDKETRAAFLNRQTAPIGRLDITNGWFVFERVNPGLYALVVSEPELGSWVYTQAGNVKVIEVTAGQVVNLGEVPFNH